MIDLHSERGFTLVEVMVAVAIMAIGILGVASMLTMSLKSDRRTQATRFAQSIALEVMEGKQSEAVDTVKDDFKSMQSSGDNKRQDGPFAYRWEITEHSTGLLRLDITVGWERCRDPKDPETCRRRSRTVNFIDPKGS